MAAALKPELKQVIVDTGVEMIRTGMTVGTWGNISVRDPETDLIYISPSGMDYLAIQPRHVVVLSLDAAVVDGEAEPSIERHMHAAVYRKRPDINAVVHTHPVFSSAFGVARMDLPAVSEDFAQIVGDRVTFAQPYELPGTEALARVAVKALGDRFAVILPNHGALAVGEDMKKALKVSLVLEKNAQVYLYASLLGTPRALGDGDIRVMQKFAREEYGRKNQNLR
jgi:L-fuculose-phosphate aldolase